MAANKLNITVLGSLNMDRVSYVARHPQPGETISCTRYFQSPGGKGGNQAVACGKLSRFQPGIDAADAEKASKSLPPVMRKTPLADVRMLGAVGDDSIGKDMLKNMSKYQVDGSSICVVDVETGFATIIVDETTGENRIVINPGANHSLTPAMFEKLPDPKPDLLIMQLEIPLDTVLAAQEAARQAGVDVLLNPAPAIPLPDSAYKGLAHLVVNETEAAILGEVKEEDLATQDGLVTVGNKFLARGVRNVIITLGSRGVFYINQQGKQGFVPALPAKVVDTTAAGDTFVGSYALSVVLTAKDAEFDIDSAIQQANKAAAKTVERRGAADSIPWLNEL